jgi:hypothetical protein
MIKGVAMQLSRDVQRALVIAIAWACVWLVLYLVNADIFPLAGASAGLLWLIAILIFHWVGTQVAQVRSQRENDSTESAPDETRR